MAKKSATKRQLEEEARIREERKDETVSAIETFFNENRKIIWTVVGVIILVGFIILAFQKFYVQPRKTEGQAQMFPAEAAFRAGEYELALNGDGNILGFADVADEYGTKAGKDIYLYAGICELQLENYENALSYLKKYRGKDRILAARALACKGDAYVGLEDYSAALGCFEKAAAKIDNIFAATYLFKAGAVCEELGETDKALGYYKKIKDRYPQSMEGYDIDKYISRIENAAE